jgi:hypothetical protein
MPWLQLSTHSASGQRVLAKRRCRSARSSSFLNGESVRRIIYSQGEVVDEYGNAMPEENDLPDWVDDDFIFEIIWRLTGLAWGEVADASYRVLSRTA